MSTRTGGRQAWLGMTMGMRSWPLWTTGVGAGEDLDEPVAEAEDLPGGRASGVEAVAGVGVEEAEQEELVAYLLRSRHG